MDNFLIRELSDDLIRIYVDPSDDSLESQADAISQSVSVQEIVCGIDNITIKYDCLRNTYATLKPQLENCFLSYVPSELKEHEKLTLPICYDIEFALDLNFVAEKLKISPGQLIEKHLANTYRIQQIGFLPGFAYCSGLDEQLNISRLPSPRQQVPAGSVGITGQQMGIYSVSSPGGWPIIGRTPLRLFQATADNPFVLRSGMIIQLKKITYEEFIQLQRGEG